MSTETSELWRLFLAFSLPESLCRELALMQSCLREELSLRHAQARWAEPEGFHLTLAFLGATDPARLPALRAACGELAARIPAFRLQVGGLGAFPDETSARVLWAGLPDCPALPGAFAELLRKRVVELGFPRERHGWNPHITLARLRHPANLGSALEPFRQRIFGEMPVEQLVLYRSWQGRYRPLERFPLGAG